MKKLLAEWAALWLILNWVLGAIFAQPLVEPHDKVFYYGVSLRPLVPTFAKRKIRWLPYLVFPSCAYRLPIATQNC